MNKKIFIAASTILALGVSVTFAANGGISHLSYQGTDKPMMHSQEKGPKGSMMRGIHQGPMHSKAIKSAIEAKDYAAFSQAFTTMVNQRTVPTQAEFDKMVEQAKTMPTQTRKDNHVALDEAIQSNNYDAFVKARDQNKKKDKTVPTQAQFAEKVTNFKQEIEKRAQHEAIRTSILANDYDAFTKAFLAATPTLPTEEEFNTMIQRHEEMTASKTTLNKETKRQKRANQARQKRTRNTQ